MGWLFWRDTRERVALGREFTWVMVRVRGRGRVSTSWVGVRVEIRRLGVGRVDGGFTRLEWVRVRVLRDGYGEGVVKVIVLFTVLQVAGMVLMLQGRLTLSRVISTGYWTTTTEPTYNLLPSLITTLYTGFLAKVTILLLVTPALTIAPGVVVTTDVVVAAETRSPALEKYMLMVKALILRTLPGCCRLLRVRLRFCGGIEDGLRADRRRVLLGRACWVGVGDRDGLEIEAVVFGSRVSYKGMETRK